jgi:hypothetical protein
MRNSSWHSSCCLFRLRPPLWLTAVPTRREKACAPDVQRFCRKLILKISRASKASARNDGAPGVNVMLPMERPDNSEGPTLEAVARAPRRLLFAAGLLLGLGFSLICYAEMFGLLQFD